jgi:hypothetical protein
MMNPRRNYRRSLVLACLGLAFAPGIGCTLINAFDSVAPQKSLDAGGTGGDAITPSMEGAAPDMTVIPMGDGGAEASSESGIVDQSAGSPASHGAIVIGGGVVQDGGKEQFVLTALDPSTGSELPKARTPMLVAAVQYDGARDLWYVFESGGAGIFPLPTDPFYLHTFTLDTITGKWTELGKVQIPSSVSFATTAVILQRLSYIAYGTGQIGDAAIPTGDAGPPFSLVTFDTSNPASVTMLGQPIPLPNGYGGMIGTNSSVSAAGGFISLGSTSRIDGGTYPQLTPFLIPGMDVPAQENPIIGTIPGGATVGFGAATIGGVMEALVVTRVNGMGTPAILSIYNPSSNDPTMALLGAGSFPFTDGNIKPPAFSACLQTALVCGINGDLFVHAVPIGPALAAGGTLTALPAVQAATGHSGQGVYFEPYTSTVLAPFSQGENFALTAFTLGGTSSAPTLTQRTAPRWSPPPDLRPNFIATKTPFPADYCNAQNDN